MDFGLIPNGGFVDTVCHVKVFDVEHESHLMVNKLTDQVFIYAGYLDDGYHCFTIFDACMKQQYPCPLVCPTKKTTVLGHRRPTWDSLHTVIDLCAGFGGLTQGSIAAGMEVSVAVDHNRPMVDLHSKASCAHHICGDFGRKEVLTEIWKHAGGASVITSGFSCQPYSRLGDGLGQSDARSDCLTKTLDAALFLNAQIIVLECVASAAQDNFVQAEISKFVQKTKFHCSQTELRLDCIWPCRRQRAWWVLTSLDVGPIQLQEWPSFSDVSQVQHVIPDICRWSDSDEHALALDEHEMLAFGVVDGKHGKYLLNQTSKSPCALHAWGSQTRPCPCGCRKWGFSKERLDSKGLHGCLVRSAVLPDGSTLIRHLHPNEAMGLNMMDPVIDFGNEVRLTLSAVGQIASPAQALWILSFVVARLAQLRAHKIFEPNLQIQAYRAWVLMRCRMVWPPLKPTDDSKLGSLVSFWQVHKDLSLAELLYPMRWDGLIQGTVSIAAVLDHLIRIQSDVPATVFDEPCAETEEEPATPWFDAPVISDDCTTVGCLYADSCTVVFEGSNDSPIRFQPKCDTTVENFVSAQKKLVGDLRIDGIFLNGRPIDGGHVMAVGQVIHVKLLDEEHACPQSKFDPIVISPTAPWTPQTDDPIEPVSPPRKVSKFDVGDCAIPARMPDPDESWLDASPFLGLHGEQFLKLHMPSIANPQQLWSVRHQYFRTADRLQILDSQDELWADDEIRFHLFALQQSYQEHHAKFTKVNPRLCVLDPLIATSWIQTKGFDCWLWGRDHPEILSQSVPIITVVLVDKHWTPVFMTPVKDVLQVQTWDAPTVRHVELDQVIHKLAESLGFSDTLIQHEHRMFFTSHLCGALAIAFLRGALIGTMLPGTAEEASLVHTKLRTIFVNELQRCQITRRPWVWGAGDWLDRPDPPRPHNTAALCITRDQRIDLINSRGTELGDDEIRFHVLNLLSHQPATNAPHGSQKFVFIEPLVYSCWESIGPAIVEQWARLNVQVREHEQHVVTAFSVQSHWIPVWFSPARDHVQVHTFQVENVGFDKFQAVSSFVADKLGFTSHAIHYIPSGLPAHNLCGAHALAFLAHVIVGMQLPATVPDLHTLHTNMRASFVAHLYAINDTPQPVIWGSGPPRESEVSPILPDDDPFASNCCAFSAEPAVCCHGLWDLLCCCGYLPNSELRAREAEVRTQRGSMLRSHAQAMGDDEILFHLQHIMDCLQCRQADGREFAILPPLYIHELLLGDPEPFREWVSELDKCKSSGCQFVTIIWIDHHWVPVWISPGAIIMCHTLADFVGDPSVLLAVLTTICGELDLDDFVIHQVPHGLPCDSLCGVSAISFIAHIVLRTPLPQDVDQLRYRGWAMKEVFRQAMQVRRPTLPQLWGEGVSRESRPLPIMPEFGPFAAAAREVLMCESQIDGFWPAFVPPGLECDAPPLLFSGGVPASAMAYHCQCLQRMCPALFQCTCCVGVQCLWDCFAQFMPGNAKVLCVALLVLSHWSPVLVIKSAAGCLVVVESCAVPFLPVTHDVMIHVISGPVSHFCGAFAWRVFAECLGLVPTGDLFQIHCALSRLQQSHVVVPPLDPIGFGPGNPLLQDLVTELSKHGIPDALVADRAKAALACLGNESVATALKHRQPWKQLKTLGNQHRFQFVLPSELSSEIAKNKGKAVAPKGKGKGGIKPIQPPAELDPGKLVVLDGTFRAGSKQLSQLMKSQIGPVSSGFVLMTMHDAEPYLSSGRPVSTEPLALVVLSKYGVELHTALPHSPVTVPCRCTVDQEPVLADAVLVQVGNGHVEKATGAALVSVDTPEVVSFKIMVYKDELEGDWNEFCSAPIRWLVSLLPMLKRCSTALRDPILDVWRRQYLRASFKPCPADQAEIFSVCVRTPKCLLEPMLALSGSAGAYCEPRSEDGKEVLAEFTVIWTPKHTLQQMQHLKQTNPAVNGLARIGDRRGLRVHSSQAKTVHQLIRPDSVYLPSGPRTLFTVGPFHLESTGKLSGKSCSRRGGSVVPFSLRHCARAGVQCGSSRRLRSQAKPSYPPRMVKS